MEPDGLFRRRKLPHWDVPGAIYFVTACLRGSIPALGLLDIERYRMSLDKRARPAGVDDRTWAVQKWKRSFVRTEDWLDHRPEVCHFTNPSLATIVVNAFHHFAGERYDLIAYAVMPSHFHWVFRPCEDFGTARNRGGAHTPARERIMHSIKRFTARECNKILGAHGSFWQDESFDHCVFDMDELARVIDYVELNPVRAGLVKRREDWPFSSAKLRITGQPTDGLMSHQCGAGL
jgi:putative transposase